MAARGIFKEDPNNAKVMQLKESIVLTQLFAIKLVGMFHPVRAKDYFSPTSKSRLENTTREIKVADEHGNAITFENGILCTTVSAGE